MAKNSSKDCKNTKKKNDSVMEIAEYVEEYMYKYCEKAESYKVYIELYDIANECGYSLFDDLTAEDRNWLRNELDYRGFDVDFDVWNGIIIYGWNTK